jgi:lipopolysaccharide export system permease protein
MKTLHLYLLRQVLATLMMTVAVFTFVLLLGNVLNEILALLINGQATFKGLASAIGLLIPFVLVFALPMGMLTAALLVFGRFSADQELTAVRASGISLVALVTPVLALSLLLCGLSAWINMDLAPRCRVAYKQLLDEMKLHMSNAMLPEGRFVKDFPNYVFYINHNDGKIMRNVIICHIAENEPVPAYDRIINAPRAILESTNGSIQAVLFDAELWERMTNGAWLPPTQMERMTIPLNTKTNSLNEGKAQISDMTFRQLQGERRELERSFALPHQTGTNSVDFRKQLRELNEMKRDVTTMILVQMHRQVAGSFACFGFTLVGIALGIRAHRRETNIGIMYALILVMIYYSFMIIAQSLQTHPEFTPYLIYWAPNFLFQIAGAIMLWRVNRGI